MLHLVPKLTECGLENSKISAQYNHYTDKKDLEIDNIDFE